MNRLELKAYDVSAMISHTEQDIECYAENIDFILSTSKRPESIKELEENREHDKIYLECLKEMHNKLMLIIGKNNP